jgi:hypothetical protein
MEKIMIYEPLKDKKQKIKNNANGTLEYAGNIKYNQGFEKGVSDSFDIFASTIESYKRYKDNVKLLMTEQKKVWKKWVEYYNGKSDIDNSNYLNSYNKWLFDYTFSDINNEKSEGLFKL